MKYIIALLSLCLAGNATAQWSPTTNQFRWMRGVSYGCKDTASFVAAGDTGIITRQCSDGKFYIKGSAGSYWEKVGIAGTIQWSDTGRVNGQIWTSYLGNKTTDSLALIKLNISDTLTMLSKYLLKTDTSYMLSPFVKYSDTAYIVANRLKISDTTYMLSGYVLNNRFIDSLNAVQSRIQTKQPLLTNPVTGTGVSGRVAYWNGTGSVTSLSTFTFDGTTVGVPNLSANTDIVAGGVLKSIFAAGTGNRIAYLDAGGTIRRGTIDPADIATTSGLAGKLNISDTAAMLAPFVEYSDTTGLYSQVVRTFGTQTVGGVKNFTDTTKTSYLRVGSVNPVANNGTGAAKGIELADNSNDGVGISMASSGTGYENETFILGMLPSSVSTSRKAGVLAIRPSFRTPLNEKYVVEIHSTSIDNGVGSDKYGFVFYADRGMTIFPKADLTPPWDSSKAPGRDILRVYGFGTFDSTLTSNGFIKSGGTSSQFLKADGTVDGNTYLTSSDITGKLNISDTATMLSNYRRKTTIIENSDLRNSAITINGTSTALGGSISVGTVTSVTASAPLSSSGGTMPNITISQASTSTNGFLSSTDWNTFNGKQAQLNGTGFVRFSGTTPSYITGTSSQFVKADGSLDGTSYATDASLSGYLPLTGGTLTGGLNGTTASFSGNVTTGGNAYASFVANGGSPTGGGGIVFQRNSVSMGSMGVSGFIDGTSSSDIALFAETGKSLLFMTGGSVTPKLTISPTGAATFSSLAGTGDRVVIANSSGTLSTSNTITSGTYTPTASNAQNAGTITAYGHQYTRIGNIVTVSGVVQYTTTASGVVSAIEITLPFSTTFTSTLEATGTATCSSNFIAGYVSGNNLNNKAVISFKAGASGTVVVANYTFQYQVL